jgi:hypothetical protein
MSYKIIVSRYNEDIEWLKDEIDNCIIYNKGKKLNIKNEILLENVGRESETYLHYIIDNYNNLPDVVVFTQARICDHVGSNDINYLINLYNDALLNGKSEPSIKHVHNNNLINWRWNKDFNAIYGVFNNNDIYKNNNKIVFIDWFIKNISIEYPEEIYIYSNGIFAINKNLILKKDIEYYKDLILEVNYHDNPIEGHFFERSWYYIFN